MNNIISALIKNSVETTKASWNGIKSISEAPLGIIMSSDLEYRQVCGSENPIAFYHNPGLMLSNSCMYIALTTLSFGEDNVPVIITDDNFKRLSKESQNFFILHEMGHLKFNHIEQINQDKFGGKLHMYKRIFFKEWKYEFEADKYAATIVGKHVAIRSLIESWKKQPIFTALQNAKELTARINSIKQL